MTLARTASRLRSGLRRFAGNRDGVSAVEFAIVLPFMLTLYLGAVEVGDGFAIQFKSTLAARTVTDLTSQYVTMDGTAMSTVLNAAAAVVSPYTSGSMVVTVSEITTNSSGRGKIVWSCSLNGTARAAGSSITLPTNLQSANITVLFGEVTYPYTPSMGYVLTGTFNIYQSAYFYPRQSTTVSLSSCT